MLPGDEPLDLLDPLPILLPPPPNPRLLPGLLPQPEIPEVLPLHELPVHPARQVLRAELAAPAVLGAVLLEAGEVLPHHGLAGGIVVQGEDAF